MLLTFFQITALLLPVCVDAASPHNIDPPLNAKNRIETFQFIRPVLWTNKDFDVLKDDSTTKMMSVQVRLKDRVLYTPFELHLTLLPSQQHLDIKINASLHFIMLFDKSSSPHFAAIFFPFV
jgi:hypothetical protein